VPKSRPRHGTSPVPGWLRPDNFVPGHTRAGQKDGPWTGPRVSGRMEYYTAACPRAGWNTILPPVPIDGSHAVLTSTAGTHSFSAQDTEVAAAHHTPAGFTATGGRPRHTIRPCIGVRSRHGDAGESSSAAASELNTRVAVRQGDIQLPRSS
jgi:hypothetical protein